MAILSKSWWTLFFLSLFLGLMIACRRNETVALLPTSTPNTFSQPTAVSSPTTIKPTPEAVDDTEFAVAVGLLFYRAWEELNYVQMYNVLSNESKARIDEPSFISFYEEAMGEATIQSVQTQIINVERIEEQVMLTVRVSWQTAVFGEIQRDHQVQLQNEQGNWGINWDERLFLPELQPGQQLRREQALRDERAAIYDVNGRLLAQQESIATLSIIPNSINNEQEMLAVLSLIFNQTPEEIKSRYESAPPDQALPIGEITGDRLDSYGEQLRPFVDAGLTIREQLTRRYPEGNTAAHILGYTGFIPAGQLERYQQEGYQGDEKVGLIGLEAWGESYLTSGGNILAIVEAGNRVSAVGESLPRSIYTTFDIEFQQEVEAALATAVESHPEGSAGAIVVLDIATGQVRAMASYPTYDPVIFDPLSPESAAGLSDVLNEPLQPLFNRAAQGEYPPGSTFKIVTMATALYSTLYTPDTEYTSLGFWDRLGPGFIKYDWLEGGHGTLTLVEALIASCNSCFYEAAFQLNEVDTNLLSQTARIFGFGTPTGINGVPEASGLVPDPEYKMELLGLPWEPGDAINMSIGQGFVLVTPLQLAQVMAAIAGDGTLLRPTLINQIGNDEETPIIWPIESTGTLPLTPVYLKAIQEGLWGVANHPELGTAYEPFEQLGIPVAGKTGTSEAGGEPHAWFAGYAPANDMSREDGSEIDQPEIAIVVLMEHVGEGSEVAAPIFRRVVELYFNIEPLTPYPSWDKEE